MKIAVKLYASLGRYLPANARENAAVIDAVNGATVLSVIDQLGVPRQYCHLVLVNGVYVAPSERETSELREGDALAVWPPVAGGVA